MSERSVIIIGSKQVGKTLLVHKLLEKDEIPKPTVAMDYSFGRKAGKSLVKDIIHFWEIGYPTSELISAALTGATSIHDADNIIVMLMLDLSKPSNLLKTFDDCLNAAQSAVTNSFDVKTVEKMKRKRADAIQMNVADIFPVKMCLVGGKYDEFKEMDLATRQLVGRTCRGFACFLGADLCYFSSKDSTLIKRIKDYAFGHSLKSLNNNYDKPLIISAGTDSFSSINLPVSSSSIVNTIKEMYQSELTFESDQQDHEPDLEDLFNDPNFNETIIDRLRLQRDEEVSFNLQRLIEGFQPQTIIADPY